MSEQMPQTLSREDMPQGQEGTNDVFFISLHYGRTTYDVPLQTGDPISTIFDFVQEVLDFPSENCRLICRGKQLQLNDVVQLGGTAGLSPGCKVMLIASSAKDISFVQKSRADPLVKGFAEEERDEQSRRKRARAAAMSSWGTKQDMEFRFNSIKAEFKYSTPPPYEAEKLLQKLSTDPGIIEIMKERHFKVGILTEMSPMEAQERMAKRGTPGMDLLGYNQNAGEMIVLRLRTDTLKGFRPYHDLINTLIHELTHNVWGEHDQKFWKLFGELKAQYMRFHRFWSHGGKTADSNVTGQFSGFTGQDDEQGQGDFGHVLGGGIPDDNITLTEGERRKRSALAAEQRVVQDSQTSTSSTAPFDFLSGNGNWMQVCPCGMQHNITDCSSAVAVNAPAEQPLASSGAIESIATSRNAVDTAAAPDDLCIAEQTSASLGSIQPDPMITPLLAKEQSACASSCNITASKESDDSAPATPVVPLTAAASSAEIDASTTAHEILCSTAGAPASVEPSEAAATEVSMGDNTPALDASELAMLGLDGAPEWLERFSGHLQALCRQGHPAARAALELLLRLVRNVVESPNESKFRRVRADNPKVRSSLLNVGTEAETLMAMLGFEASIEDGQRVFVLRDAVFDCARLHMGKEVLERHLNSVLVSSH